jgi:hypothetical protein
VGDIDETLYDAGNDARRVVGHIIKRYKETLNAAHAHECIKIILEMVHDVGYTCKWLTVYLRHKRVDPTSKLWQLLEKDNRVVAS